MYYSLYNLEHESQIVQNHHKTEATSIKHIDQNTSVYIKH